MHLTTMETVMFLQRPALALVVALTATTLLSFILLTTMELSDAGCTEGALDSVLQRAHRIYVALIIVLILSFIVPYVLHRQQKKPSRVASGVHVLVATAITLLVGISFGIGIAAKPLLEAAWTGANCNEAFADAYGNTDVALWIALVAYAMAVIAGHFISAPPGPSSYKTVSQCPTEGAKKEASIFKTHLVFKSLA